MKKYKVYCLKDKTGEIKYIGQTRQSLSRRLNCHKLTKKDYGEFTIELIADFDDPEPMFKLEAMLIEQYNLIEIGWNKSEGYKNGKKDFDASKANNGFYGHTHSKEVKEKIGKRSIGNNYAKGNRSRKGLKNSKEHQKALIQSKQKKVLCLDDGRVFKSGRQAAKFYGLQPSKISNVCHGKRKSTGGLRFCFVDDKNG